MLTSLQRTWFRGLAVVLDSSFMLIETNGRQKCLLKQLHSCTGSTALCLLPLPRAIVGTEELNQQMETLSLHLKQIIF